MEKFSIIKFVPEILRDRPGQRLNAREIASLIMQVYPQACEDKRIRSRASIVPLDSTKVFYNKLSQKSAHSVIA